MNSNLKLLPAALLVAVLALAGCGGGSDSEPVDPGPTAEEQMIMDLKAEIAALRAALGLAPGDDAVATIAELQAQLKELQDAKDAADAVADAAAKTAKNAMAKKLHGYLTGTATHVTTAADVGGNRHMAADAVSGSFGNYNTAEFMDTDAAGNVIHVLQYDNKMSSGTEPLTADVDAAGLTANPKSIMAAVFSSNEPKDHAVTDGRFSVRGTYNGAPGEYICAGTDAGACVSRAADGGGIQLLGSGTWSFDPDAGAMQTKPDAKYATFGWWLDEAAAGDAEGTRKVRAFSYVQTGDAVADLTGVTGSASYSGIAVGKAALNAALGDDNIGDAFTANAALSATFSATPMLEGEITDFMVGGESRNWSVKLNEQAIDATGTVAASTGSTVWTIDGVKATAGGGWQAQMYDQGADIGTIDQQPNGVTGGFQAVFGADGNMTGAFAAEK